VTVKVTAAAVLAVAASVGCDAGRTSVGSYTPTTSVYLEAESATLSGAFGVGKDPAASGGEFIVADAGGTFDMAPGEARAQYSVTLDAAGTYVLWGRIRAPDTFTNRFWVQVDGGPWFLWRITVGDIWFWNYFHNDFDYTTRLTFDLAAGRHDLVVANSVDGAELDRLYFTNAGDVPPGNDTLCSPPNSIEVDGSCLPSCGSQGGNACGVEACQGLPTTQNYDCPVCCVVPNDAGSR
jgi:hypothetical protein